MLLKSTSLWISIYLGVIQMVITEVTADSTTKNNATQSGIVAITSSDIFNPDKATIPYPKNDLNNLTFNNLLSLGSTDYGTCNFTLSYNISNMGDSKIKSLIQSQARDITEKITNVTKAFEEIEIIRANFTEGLNFSNGAQALNLGLDCLEISEPLLDSIKEHNSLIRAYKCMNKSQNNDINEIAEEELEKISRYNEEIYQFYSLYGLAETYGEVYSQNEKLKSCMKKFNSSQTLNDLDTVLAEMNITEKIIEKLIQEQENFHNSMGNDTLRKPFRTKTMFLISNITHWKEVLQNRKNNLKDYEKLAAEKKFEKLLNKTIQPVLNGIIFAVGFVGNFVLLIIFARHKEIRNPPSMMILNLTLADAFNLPINIPVFLMYLTSNSWDYGEGLCITFRFLRQLGIAVSIYSIVVISIQRFLALTQMFKNDGWASKIPTKLKSVLLISSVWIIGSLIAIPHAIHAGVYDGQCYGAPKDYKGYGKFITLFDFILFCAVPLYIIATLSIGTALFIKKSVRNIPGESMGMDKYIKSRIISANVLIALTVVSAASYVPYYLFMLLFAWDGIQIETQQYQISFFVVYTLVFANCCFNPIALYIFSHKFRKYFHKYLLCRKIEAVTDGRKLSSGTTTSYSFMTKI